VVCDDVSDEQDATDPSYDDAGIARRIAQASRRLEDDTSEQLVAHAARLEEVVRHREWRIAELERHIANLEARLGGLAEHAGNLERELSPRIAHAKNLESDLAKARARVASLETHVANVDRAQRERDARIALLEEHVENLEARMRRPLRLAERGIFPDSSDPHLDALFRHAEKLRADRPDLARFYPDDAPGSFWYWLLHPGPACEPAIAAHWPDLPPPSLMRRVVGEESEAGAYWRSGLIDWRSLDESLREAGFDPRAGGRLLDFGAGCGRVLQFFRLYSDLCELHGADVDAEAMRWCRASLPFAHFHALPGEPPCRLADRSFDAIYAFSVFSHLDEAAQLDWLAELARIARPGAALVLTVQGPRTIERFLAGETPQTVPRAGDLRRQQGAFERRSFLFFPYRRLALADEHNRRHYDDWDLDRYGSTFIGEAYIREHWSRWFEVVRIREAPDDWQDHVLLRRR